MSISRISFFTLLVILAITEIYSSPAGGKGSKSQESPGGKKTADENVRDINERRVSEDIHENSAVNSQTVNKQVDAVSGDNGYISPNSAGPSESNPSHGNRVDSTIHSTNPLSDALSFTHLGNKPETLTQLSEKVKNTKSGGTLETKASETSLFSRKIDEMKSKLNRHEASLMKPNKLPWDPQDIDPMRQATPIEAISREIEIPDIISLKFEFEGSDYTDLEVPQHVKTNPKSYKAWFMEELPQKGYYQAKVGSNEVSKLKSLEQTKTIIKLQDPTTYGFVAPYRFISIDPYSRAVAMDIPYRAKVDLDEFNKWLHEEMPKHYELYIMYNPSLSIKYRGSLEYIGIKGPQY